MTMHKALHPRDDVDRLCQEKSGEEDLPAYNDLKITKKKKSAEEYWLQPSEIIQTTLESTEQK